MVRGSHGTITISPSIRLDTLRDSDIKIEISVWYINVVNFSPFLSYALFGGAVAAITVTKHGTISTTFGLWDFLLKKVLLEDWILY